MKMLTIVGARPQFIKAAVVSRAIRQPLDHGSMPEIDEVLVHTGQHYDQNMSRVFFEQLDIPEPKYNLGVSAGSHGRMTGSMLIAIEDVILIEKPDRVLVYGDTNSTLAGALAAAKLHIPVAHVEAGLRSFNRRMPEEINRVLTDRISDLLFCPSKTAITNLKQEGMTDGVLNIGDVMYDAFIQYRKMARDRSTILLDLGIQRTDYCLATLHRQENTDDPDRLSSIFSAFQKMASRELPLILPLHPRTKKCLKKYNIEIEPNSGVRIISPVNYLDMIALESSAQAILTDSGGMQKEAYFAGVPCVTLRDETEWVETVEVGANHIAGAESDSILSAFIKIQNSNKTIKKGLYGDGHAAEKIINALISAKRAIINPKQCAES
jgi:UDP-GlcNAc3NAcA epimerase